MSSTSKYNAEHWAVGKTLVEIQEEIYRIKEMRQLKITNPFPKNAEDSHCRLCTLQKIVKSMEQSKSSKFFFGYDDNGKSHYCYKYDSDLIATFS